MNQNNFRRSRSPPFAYYGQRPVMDGREYDNMAYPPIDHNDLVARNHQLSMTHVQHQHLNPHLHYPQQSYTEGSPHDYPAGYRDHHRISSSSRPTSSNRDHYMIGSMTQQPRPPSPPYKILCITNISNKVSDGSIKEALVSDFSRFGDISVSVTHDNGERLAYIYFRSHDEAKDARHARIGTVLFDRPIEIEPIYEPIRDTNGSPANGSSPNNMLHPVQPMYSPRRRSISPAPNTYPHDTNGPTVAAQRRYPSSRSHLQHGSPPTPIIYPHHRSMVSPEYFMPPAGYPYNLSPQPPALGPVHVSPYERRIDYSTSSYNPYPPPPPPQPMNSGSPYSSPPPEQYRPTYPVPPPSHHPSSNHYPVDSMGAHSPHQSSGHFSASMSRGDRARISNELPVVQARSPKTDPFYPVDGRGPPTSFAQPHSSRSGYTSPQPPLAPPPPATSSRRSRRPSSRSRRRGRGHAANPPARFIGREFRREKFSGEHSGELEDGRPSRVLLVNNIDATKTESDLRETFESHGIIEDMEVKEVGPDISSALIKFSSMDGAYKAKTANNGRYIGNSRCRIVYGKVSASHKLWIGGLSPSTTVRSLEDECSRYGDLISMEYTAGRPYCYVEYESANQAQFAAHHLKSSLTPASERKIRVEFVDPERSDRLTSARQDSNMNTSEPNTKLRSKESTYDIDRSPRSNSVIFAQKRSVSPIPSDLSKRVCQTNEVPMGANTFKQERLVAAAAAKARTSSTTSSLISHPSERSEKAHEMKEAEESNDMSDINQTSNGDFSVDQTLDVDESDLSTQEPPSVEKLSKCISMNEVIHCCSITWPSRLVLRNFTFPAQVHLCSGRKELIDKYLAKPRNEDGDIECPLLNITQRWRLHPQPKLEEVKRRMQTGNLGILIFTPRQDGVADRQMAPHSNPSNSIVTRQNGDSSEPDLDKTNHTSDKSNPTMGEPAIGKREKGLIDSHSADTGQTSSEPANQASAPSFMNQSRPLRNLISYLEQKDAAGVISLSALDVDRSVTEGAPKLLYTFPPGDFALNLLKTRASNLTNDATKEEFLLGVIVGGNVEGKM